MSFKKGDRLDARNWRPISLLNIDYKLASRAVARRLLKVLHLVVAKDQTCSVPERYIGENVAFLRDVVDYATVSNVPVAILSLDQEKAFDRVDWGFLYATLSKMGFGSSFIRWVRLFYTGVQSCVKVNGYLSPFFLLSRGVRQGCPLSPLLYVLVSEVLAVNIRANPRVIGLSLPNSPDPLSPISQYADDTSLVVCSDDSIRACFKTYALFEKGSGAKLNQSKSKGLWLGSWSGRQDPPVDLDWSSVKLKVLAVFLGPGDLEEDNWRPRITTVENVLTSWKQHILLYRGRALVINALALSRVWYVASLVHMPTWVLSELCKLVFNFSWKGKPDLVSRSVVVQPTCSGGFEVVDVKLKVGRQDPPVDLDWSSVKLKVLAVFLGPGDLEEDNWRPRITTVENVLTSWKQHILLYRGRALVINALALSRVWYVASLVHMPTWVLSELCKLVFNFFWKGKPDLVSRSVVVQPTCSGGFEVVDVKLKVWSLVVQWIRRFTSSPSAWSSFMSYWFRSLFDASCLDVFSRPFSFDPRVLPLFYRSLLLAWRAVDGGFPVSRSSLIMASSSPHHLMVAPNMSAKFCYLYLLSENLSSPHYVEKFLPTFGDLYWSSTWRELFFDTDRPVTDVAWKITHGVLYTADRLLSFGYSLDPHCFCGPVLESPPHLFFHCPLAQSVLSWLQSLMNSFSLRSPSLLCHHALFGFNPEELCRVPKSGKFPVHFL